MFVLSPLVEHLFELVQILSQVWHVIEHQLGERLEFVVLGQVRSVGQVEVHVEPVSKFDLKEDAYDVISLFVRQIDDEATFGEIGRERLGSNRVSHTNTHDSASR